MLLFSARDSNCGTYVVENMSVTSSSVTVAVTMSVEVSVKVLWASVIVSVGVRVVSTVYVHMYQQVS